LISALRGGSVSETGDLVAALVDLARALDTAGIAHALIGGLAVGLYVSERRPTVDVDVAVATSIDSDRIAEVLEAGGFTVTGRFEHSVTARHSSGERVRVAFDESFDRMIERAEALDVNGVPIRVVTRADLIATKERAAADPSRRPSKAYTDRADVELLKGDELDPDEGW
jgi:predicted nucleotidyltransferase